MKKVFIFLMVAVMAISMSLPAFAAPLTDVPDNHWAAEAVNMLTETGILTGYTDQTFKGQQNITRYEIAVALQRLLIYVQASIEEQLSVMGTSGGVSNAELNQLKKELDALRDSSASVNDLLTLSGRLSYLESRAGVTSTTPPSSAEISELAKQVDELGKQVTTLTSQYIGFANDVTVLSGKITNVDKEIINLKAADATFKSDIAALNSEVDALKAFVSSLTTSQSGTVEVDTVMYNNLLTLSGRLSYLESKYAAGIEMDPAVLAEINSLKGQIENLKSQTSVKSADLISFTNDISVLSSKLTSLERNVNVLSNDLAALKKEVDGLKTYVSSISASGVEVDPAVLAEIDNLKNQISNMGSRGSVSSIELVALTNDITVLSNKLIKAEAGIDNLKTANADINKNVLALNNRLSLLESNLGNVSISDEFGKVKELENTVLSLSKSVKLSEIVLKNDITTTNRRIDDLDYRIITLTDKTKANDALLTSEIAALEKEVAELSAFLDSVTDEDWTIVSDPKLYNDFLTVSGRVSYIESKLANATLINPNLENDVADLKVKLAEANTTVAALKAQSVKNTADIATLKAGTNKGYVALYLGYDRSTGGDPKTTFNLFRIGIKGTYVLNDRFSLAGGLTARVGKNISAVDVGFEIIPEVDLYGRFRAFTFGKVDLGLMAGVSSAYSFDYTTDVGHTFLFGIGLYVDAYVTNKLNIYGNVTFPIVTASITDALTIDTGFVPAFGIDATVGIKYDISPSINVGFEAGINNAPKLISGSGMEFNVGFTVGFTF